jgi:hypothetical protein
MRQVPDYADIRNKGFCVHCGAADETSDHVPSKTFLDEPFPENLPVSPSCFRCNNNLSLDEEYLACLLECVIAGAVDPDKIERPRVARSLTRKHRLTDRLKKARHTVGEQVVWDFEADRIRGVLLKLARGHAAFELNEPRIDAPDAFSFKPLTAMTSGERDVFEGNSEARLAPWPEVGSRAMHKLLIVGSDVYEEGWLVVQEGRYRYRTSQDDGLRVRLVIREYLACETAWY